jgi:hypothetical protein
MTVKTDAYIVGQSTIDTNNFLLQTNGAGNLHLHRGSDGLGSVLLRVASDNSVLATAGALGYGTGAGGSVTQLTSKATGVTLDKPSGAITLNNAALAAATIVSFTLTNSYIATTDTVIVNVKSGNATVGTYTVWAEGILAGSCKIVIENRSAGSLSEALVLNYSVIKGSLS